MVNVQCFTKKGLYHKKKGEESQDAIIVYNEQNGLTVAAVCDGASFSAYSGTAARVVAKSISKYGFANIYILNPFDRFAIMTLLSDFPVGVWSELVYPGVELNPNKEEDMES